MCSKVINGHQRTWSRSSPPTSLTPSICSSLSLSAGGRRQASLDIELAEAAELELVPAHDAEADERPVLVRLVEAPLPHLRSISALAPPHHHTRTK